MVFQYAYFTLKIILFISAIFILSERSSTICWTLYNFSKYLFNNQLFTTCSLHFFDYFQQKLKKLSSAEIFWLDISTVWLKEYLYFTVHHCQYQFSTLLGLSVAKLKQSGQASGLGNKVKTTGKIVLFTNRWKLTASEVVFWEGIKWESVCFFLPKLRALPFTHSHINRHWFVSSIVHVSMSLSIYFRKFATHFLESRVWQLLKTTRWKWQFLKLGASTAHNCSYWIHS